MGVHGPGRWRQSTFSLLIVYYWLMLITAHWYTSWDRTIELYSGRYWLLVLPVAIFAPVCVTTLRVGNLRRETAWLFAFAAMVGLAAVVKGNPYEALNLLLLGATIGAIIQARLEVSASLLNVLFLLSCVWCILLTFTGQNAYGFLPWGAPTAEIGIGWRVSLFPQAVVGSALLSLVVIIANMSGQGGRYRKLVLPLAYYFAILSANRTVLICLAFLGLFLLVRRRWPFGDALVYRWFIPLALLAFFAIFALLPLLAIRLWNADAWLTGFLFRNQAGEIADFDINRLVIWRTHLQVLIDNPLLGGSARELPIVFRGEVISTGSESFLTRVAAQTGLAVLLLLFHFRAAAQRARATRNARAFVTLLMLAVLSISYGSFIVPYDMVFLTMVALIASSPPALDQAPATDQVRNRRPRQVSASGALLGST
jgi:hypothetical protein